MSSQAVASIELKSLELVASGKVRELYRIDDHTLLIVATDRVSVFDTVCSTAIPDKGAILTQMTAFWYNILGPRIREFKHQCLGLKPPSGVLPSERAILRGRSMVCRKLKVFPIEIIVRGYIDGSAWAEYQKHGTINSVHFEPGLSRCQSIPGGPIYTPSTKAAPGEKDENITREQARSLVSDKYADRIEQLALKIYETANEYALSVGIAIADTKMEFGLDEVNDEIIVVDELLTPDCSRFWPAPVVVGEEQPSLDKQSIRNFVLANGLKGKSDIVLPDSIVDDTTKRYRDVFTKLTGETLEEALARLQD